METFRVLSEEKKTRILHAALREFGRYGYEKTSAEQIAKAANISKGMVFHYFGNKQGLYEYLMRYCADYMETYFGNAEKKIQGLDYLEQYRRLTHIKLESYLRNPFVYEFLTMLFLHSENAEISEAVKEDYSRLLRMQAAALQTLQESLQTGPFRKDMDPENIKKYMAWMIDGFSQDIIRRLEGVMLADEDLDPYWAQADRLMDDMRTLFYETEEEE